MTILKSAVLAIITALAFGCATVSHPAGSPLTNLLDSNHGIPILDPADLQATHAILAPAVANGAGYKIRAFDNCAVAWLAHPEYLTPSTPPSGAIAAPPAATAGPISEIAAEAVKVDAGARMFQKKIALFNAPLPDDVVIACAPLEVTVGGIVHAFKSFLHPGQ